MIGSPGLLKLKRADDSVRLRVDGADGPVHRVHGELVVSDSRPEHEKQPPSGASSHHAATEKRQQQNDDHDETPRAARPPPRLFRR